MFADVVGTRLGMCGVEYFAHPWEFGPRKTKELLLTGDALDAENAHQLGMVSKIFPADELDERTLEFARRVAKVPTMAALLIKESVNQTVDAMGFSNALNSCFSLHELNHSHWMELSGGRTALGTVEFGVADWRASPEVRLARKGSA
jgi:enoyl-CoA hydratase